MDKPGNGTYSEAAECWPTAGPLLGAPSLGGAVKGFPVSKLAQVRGSRACLRDPGRAQLASLLALLIPSAPPCSRLLDWQNWERQPSLLAGWPPGGTHPKPCPSMAEHCSLTARGSGSRCWSRQPVFQIRVPGPAPPGQAGWSRSPVCELVKALVPTPRLLGRTGRVQA